MASPSYTTDLTDVDDAEAATNWAESTDGSWDDGGVPDADADYPFIQNATAISQTMTKTTICSLLADNGSGVTIPTDGAFLVWQNWFNPAGLDTYGNGGLRVLVGSGLGDFYWWASGGSDFGRNPYGGWQNVAVNPGVTAGRTSVGSPTSTYRYIGSAASLIAAPSKGQPHSVDVIRWGRCEMRVNGGETADYATFAGMAAKNDNNEATDGYNVWGLFQAIAGGYLWKGLMRLGYSSAVDFRDSDVLILVDATDNVTSGFNQIDVEQSGSRVDWTNVTIQALGTVSPGGFECVADADINFDGCKFIDMGAFIFDSQSTVLNTTFQRCGQVTSGVGTFTGCLFEESPAAIAITCESPAAAALISNTDFISDGSGHAIEITGTAANITLTNVGFTGYSGTSTDAAIYVNIASGTMNIAISGGDTPSIRTAGATVTTSTSPVTTQVTVKDGSTLAVIENARVLLLASDGTGNFPYQQSITSINRSGAVATVVTPAAHGLVTDDIAHIAGATEEEYNGAFAVTYISTTSFSYTVPGTPSTPAGGTKTVTGGYFNTLTNASGIVTDSRSHALSQPVEGWVRMGTASPYYRTGIISDTVDKDAGFSVTVFLSTDGT